MSFRECGGRRQHRLRNVRRLIRFFRNQFAPVKRESIPDGGDTSANSRDDNVRAPDTAFGLCGRSGARNDST